MGTWGVDLWDNREFLEKHTHNGIEFLDKCTAFMRERIRIEQDYAKSLRRLVKQYNFKKKEEEDIPYTYQHSFKSFLQENDDFAGQREVIAEELHNNIFKEMQKLSLDSKTERKKTLQKLTDYKNQLDQHHKVLQVAKKKYDQASEDASTSYKGYETASASLDMTKAQILKFKKASQDKGNLAEKSREEYKGLLDAFNGKQTLYYEGDLPDIINSELQVPEEKRIEKLSTFLQEYALVQQKVAPIIAKCFEGMKDAAKSCNPGKDSLTLIDRHKTGEIHPSDVEFEEWGKPPTGSTLSLAGPKAKTSKPWGGKKKEALSNENIANDFSDLPPAQRKKKFNKSISTLEEQLVQLEKAKAGMLKIKETSEKFGGDPESIQGQIEVNQKEIDRIKPLIEQYQCYLKAMMDVEGSHNRPTSVQDNSTPPSAVSAVEPLPEVSPAAVFPHDEFDDELRCTVVYDFGGTNEGEMTVYAGEELVIVDEDDGSGWTRITRGGDEGYIPTSYIERF